MPSGGTYTGPVWVEIDRIDPKPACEMRASVVDEAVEEYAENFDQLPPIKVVADADDKHWTADGSYRLRAARKLGKKKIQCLVMVGSYLDAFGEASKANKGHGVRITRADKVARVESALRFPELAEWSNRRIAEYCQVSSEMIDTRRQVPFNGTTRIGRDGKRQAATKRNAPSKPKADKPKPAPVEPEPEWVAHSSNGDRVVATAPTPEVAKEEVVARGEPGPIVEPRQRPERIVSTVVKAPEPVPVVEPEEPDWDAKLDEERSRIVAFIGEWPEEYRGMVIIMLKSIVGEFAPLCPNFVDRSGEVFA